MYKDAHKVMYMLMEKHTVNPSHIGYTKVYLGTDIGKVDYGDVSYVCTMSLYYYIK